MTDLVLVRPGVTSRAEIHWSHSLPLGLGYLASSCRSNGISVAIVDGKLDRHSSVGEVVKVIIAHNPMVVGISALTIEFPLARTIAKRLKDIAPSTIIILGGAHANALPSQSLSESPEFDYLIAGEAESSIVEFVKSVRDGSAPDLISGLYRRTNDNSIVRPVAARYDHDIESLPFPAWDLFPRLKNYPIMAERGCPYNCSFCSNNMSRRVRTRSTAHVMEELEWLHSDFSPQRIYFEDETFGLNRGRTEELLVKMIEFNKNKGLHFKAQTRIDRISDRLLRLMKAAGFEYLEIGVESGSQKVLDASRKGICSGAIEDAVRSVKRAGIKAWVNFIIGLPGESLESARSSIDLAVRLNPNRLSVAIIVAYPGTDIYAWALEGRNGYRLLSSDWSRFDKYLSASVELENLSYATMRRLQLQMYTETYLRNLRFFDFLKLVWNNRAFIKPAISSLISSHLHSNLTS